MYTNNFIDCKSNKLKSDFSHNHWVFSSEGLLQNRSLKSIKNRTYHDLISSAKVNLTSFSDVRKDHSSSLSFVESDSSPSALLAMSIAELRMFAELLPASSMAFFVAVIANSFIAFLTSGSSLYFS